MRFEARPQIWSSPSKHGWPAREHPGSICLTSSIPALTGWATTLGFLTWIQGSHSGPRAYVVAGYFANSYLPSPLVIIFKCRFQFSRSGRDTHVGFEQAGTTVHTLVFQILTGKQTAVILPSSPSPVRTQSSAHSICHLALESPQGCRGQRNSHESQLTANLGKGTAQECSMFSEAKSSGDWQRRALDLRQN